MQCLSTELGKLKNDTCSPQYVLDRLFGNQVRGNKTEGEREGGKKRMQVRVSLIKRVTVFQFHVFMTQSCLKWGFLLITTNNLRGSLRESGVAVGMTVSPFYWSLH